MFRGLEPEVTPHHRREEVVSEAMFHAFTYIYDSTSNCPRVQKTKTNLNLCYYYLSFTMKRIRKFVIVKKKTKILMLYITPVFCVP